MGRKRFRPGPGYVPPPDLRRLQEELHERRPHRRPEVADAGDLVEADARPAEPQTSVPMANMAIGRLIVSGSVRELQQQLVDTAPTHGYRVTGLSVSLGAAYITWNHLRMLPRQHPARTIQTPAVMRSIAHRRTSEMITASEAGELRATEGIIAADALMLECDRSKRGRQNKTTIRLGIAAGNPLYARLSAERQAVRRVYDPSGQADAIGITGHLLVVPLVDITAERPGRHAQLLMDAVGPVPGQVEFGPVTDFDYIISPLDDA